MSSSLLEFPRFLEYFSTENIKYPLKKRDSHGKGLVIKITYPTVTQITPITEFS